MIEEIGNELTSLFGFFNIKGKKSSFNSYLNNVTFLNLFVRLQSIFLDLFEWKGLPETCDVEYLEKSLFWTGRGIFVNDNDYGWLSLRANESINRNIYNRALRWRAIGFNGYNKEYLLDKDGKGLAGDNAVLVRNNKLRYPTAFAIFEYIVDLTQVKRAMMVNVNSTKTPIIFYGDEKSIKTAKNAYKQIENNEGILYLDSSMAGTFEILNDTKAYVADKLLGLKHDLLSELLALFGIKYIVTEKKERLITDEANNNNMFADISVKTMLETRQEAAKYLSEILGTEVTCELKYKYQEYVDGNIMEDDNNEPNKNTE